MKSKLVPSGWLDRNGRRLDCGPYVSGALEARVKLEALRNVKETLSSLTRGHKGGIYNGPQFRRNYVTSAAHGVPFLTGGDVQLADLSRLPLLRNRDAASAKLSYLRLSPGMTLVSCSGSIGRMAYVRPDMDGIWSSQDVIKIVADPSKIPSGYLYAYLRSKFGVPLVIGGTYGAIIQHIEPEHIADLPVPRFGKRLELRVHDLVQSAATLRAESCRLLELAKQQAALAWGLDPAVKFQAVNHPDIGVVNASELRRNSRFDAFYYGNAATASDEAIAMIAKRIPVKRIADSEVSVEVFEPARFGRVSVDDERFGVAFLSISDMMRGEPKAESFISQKQAKRVRAVVNSGWLILPRVGQLQGVFGTVSYVARHLDRVAVSDNNIRIVPVGPDEGAYLWAALSTDLLYRQIVRRACGASIPYIDSKRVGDIPVPWPSREQRLSIAESVKQAMELRSRASKCEADAVNEVERAIEAGGPT